MVLDRKDEPSRVSEAFINLDGPWDDLTDIFRSKSLMEIVVFKDEQSEDGKTEKDV